MNWECACSWILLTLACSIFILGHFSSDIQLRIRNNGENLTRGATTPPPPQARLNQTINRTKVLYTITSLVEYDTGKRSTVQGNDRFQKTLIPVVADGVTSMLSFQYDVDVVLICHYKMRPERLELLRQRLPKSVGLEVWDDATALSYNKEDGMDRIKNVTRILARQHRYVIKDKLLYYDFFVNFEDDMLIKGEHLDQYIQMTKEIHLLRKNAVKNLPEQNGLSNAEAQQIFHGNMTQAQLSRLIPGFIRVEVVKQPVKTTETYITMDATTPAQLVDPSACCQRMTSSLIWGETQDIPDSNQLYLWETAITALGVRKLPSKLGWVLLQRGTLQDRFQVERIIGDYWSGRDGDFGKEERPAAGKGNYLNNQGGWMATRQQIWEWHTQICKGGFLPPFEKPRYPSDGMNNNVEYWSGGINLVGSLACALQRIVSLEPQEFSRHLLYHTSNNKQDQLGGHRARFTRVNDLLGQLNTVKQRAEKVMIQEQRGTK